MKNISKYFRQSLGRFLLLVLLFCSSATAWAQGWYEYWFDLPEVSRYHAPDGAQINVYLHLIATGGPTSVALTLPAQTGFTPTVFDIPSNGKIRVNLVLQVHCRRIGCSSPSKMGIYVSLR